MTPQKYCAVGFNNELLQLSDRRVMWDITNKIPDGYEVDDEMYGAVVFQHLENLEERYHTEFYVCGCNGRHICVEDTPTNRRNYRHMVKAVNNAIDSIINEEMEFYITKSK